MPTNDPKGEYYNHPNLRPYLRRMRKKRAKRVGRPENATEAEIRKAERDSQNYKSE